MKNFKSSIERQKLEICLGSVMELPYSDNFFDRVFHVNCFYFWPDLDQGISELRRVMKTDGLMVSTFLKIDSIIFLKKGCLNMHLIGHLKVTLLS